MSNLPTPEQISKVTDVNSLRDACLALLRVAEKERNSKVKYRNSATSLKQELDSVKMELQCLEEKNAALIELVQNSKSDSNNQNIQINSNENSDNSEMKSKIDSLENQIEEMKKQQEININKIKTLINTNASLEQEKSILESQIKKSESTYETLNHQIGLLNSDKETYELKIKNYEEKITLLQVHLTQLKKSAQSDSNLESQLNSLTEENAKLATKVVQLENLQSENSELKEKHKTEVAKLTDENRILQQKLEQIETQTKLNEISIKTAQLESQANLENLRSENSSFKEELEKAQKLNEELGQKVEEYEQKIGQYEMENSQLTKNQEELVSITMSNKEKAKERIVKLKLANEEMEKSHKTELETIKEESEQKQKELENQINSIQEEKNNLIESNKEKVAKMKSQKANLKSKIDLLKQENEKLKSNIAQLEITVHDSNVQNEVMIQKISEFEKSKDDSLSLEQTNSSLNSTIQKMSIEIIELKEKIKSEENLQSAVNDRDKTIVKLKEQIQLFIKNDKEKSEKMNSLQDELCELTNKVATLSAQENSNAIDQLAIVEREKADLEKKIENSEASFQLMEKNQKLNDMIEKYNKMYTQVKDENEQLKLKLAKFTKSYHLSFSCDIICDFFFTEIKKPNQPVLDNQKVVAENKKSKAEKKMAQKAYLKRVLLQFFTEEEKNRPTMIPVILKLVGCNDEQISAVTRQWERSNNLFSGLFGF